MITHHKNHRIEAVRDRTKLTDTIFWSITKDKTLVAEGMEYPYISISKWIRILKESIDCKLT